jgi:hypothetical protein
MKSPVPNRQIAPDISYLVAACPLMELHAGALQMLPCLNLDTGALLTSVSLLSR